jgi:hypothetical protein
MATMSSDVASRPGASHWRRLLLRVAAYVRSIMPRGETVEQRVASRYDCHRWCDSTERQMIDEIVHHRRTRL